MYTHILRYSVALLRAQSRKEITITSCTSSYYSVHAHLLQTTFTQLHTQKFLFIPLHDKSNSIEVFNPATFHCSSKSLIMLAFNISSRVGPRCLLSSAGGGDGGAAPNQPKILPALASFSLFSNIRSSNSMLFLILFISRLLKPHF